MEISELNHAHDDSLQPFESLSLNQLRLTRWIGGLSAALISVLAIGALAVAYSVRPQIDGPFSIAVLLVALLVATSIGLGYVFPGLAYRRTSWRLSLQGLEIRRGVWWRHQIVVPQSRIQHSDIEQGPLQRHFDLSTLIVHTAGTKNSSVSLEGIRHETAEQLREALISQRLSRGVNESTSQHG
ncbi:Bacterial membrane flanked domain protein [Rubripirellula tenax]|uniref:Bacterial membrane flanked domain protein n=1 Tax=Rubripirellula tenax TaxID=2528015 RepID=A0A5C6F755_9BACT|nr:PH domain-containing protein [Rubripirellula tenax]TWU56802.1 Bacterial membrane flanked domain protein [Rubripirellula tenax]